MNKHENEKDPRKMNREEMAAEFERLLRKLSPADLQKVKDKMLEMLAPEQREQLQAEWKAAEEERIQEEADLRALGAKLQGFSIGRLAIAPGLPKQKGGKV